MENQNQNVSINTAAGQEDNLFCGLCFAGRCGSCGYYSPDDPNSGWCNRHGGWVNLDTGACGDYV